MKIEGQLMPFYHRRRKLDYFLNHTWRITEGRNPDYYTKLSIKIPCPRSADDPAIILVTLHNPKRSYFMTFTSVLALEDVFNLEKLASQTPEGYENLKARIEQELKNAEIAREILEKATKDIHDAAFSKDWDKAKS